MSTIFLVAKGPNEADIGVDDIYLDSNINN